MVTTKLIRPMKRPLDTKSQADKHQRFKQLRLKLGLNQQQLAKSLGVTQAHISKVEKGDSFVTSHILDKLSKQYNVNTDWLLTGKGIIFHTSDSQIDKGKSGGGNGFKAGNSDQDLEEIKIAIDDINTRLESIDERLGKIESNFDDLISKEEGDK